MVKKCLSRMSGKLSRTVLRRGKGSNPFSLVDCMAYEFRTLLRKYQVIQSLSKPGVPFDNAVAESFFASIKKEEFRRSFYNTEEELHKAVREYIEYFNDYRPHQRMGFQTPNQVERDFYNSL
jgi:putative transposase